MGTDLHTDMGRECQCKKGNEVKERDKYNTDNGVDDEDDGYDKNEHEDEEKDKAMAIAILKSKWNVRIKKKRGVGGIRTRSETMIRAMRKSKGSRRRRKSAMKT